MGIVYVREMSSKFEINESRAVKLNHLLLNDCIMVDDLVCQLEQVHINYVDIASLCTKKHLITVVREATGCHCLQFPSITIATI